MQAAMRKTANVAAVTIDNLVVATESAEKCITCLTGDKNLVNIKIMAHSVCRLVSAVFVARQSILNMCTKSGFV